MLAGRQRLLGFLKPSLGGLLWRTAKADVVHELGLPPQQQHTSQLHFNAIERHFYSRQHAECSTRARSTIPAEVSSPPSCSKSSQQQIPCSPGSRC